MNRIIIVTLSCSAGEFRGTALVELYRRDGTELGLVVTGLFISVFILALVAGVGRGANTRTVIQFLITSMKLSQPLYLTSRSSCWSAFSGLHIHLGGSLQVEFRTI